MPCSGTPAVGWHAGSRGVAISEKEDEIQADRIQADRNEGSALEPLPGAIVPQFIRCGKPGCRCACGHRHGPYFYRVWREGPKVYKEYVKITEVEGVRQQTLLYEALHQELRRLIELRLSLAWRLARRRYLRSKEVHGKNNQARQEGQPFVRRLAIPARLAEEKAHVRLLPQNVQATFQHAEVTAAEVRRVIAASRELRAGIAERRRMTKSVMEKRLMEKRLYESQT